MGALGIAQAEGTARWRLLEGSEIYLRLVAGVIDARVLVDTTGTLVSGVYGMVDLGSLSIEFTEPKADAGHPLVILPDTVEMRELIDALLANSENQSPETTSITVSALGCVVSRRDPTDSMKLAVLRANCSVTGLCRRGRWEDAAELEAARVLLLTRFDLRLGIWDLALNPALRSSVLEPVAVPPPQGQSLAAPTGARERALRDAESARARRQAKKNAIANIVASLQPYLGKVGWIVDDNGGLSRPLTEPLAIWPDAERRFLVVLRLEINKATARIVVWQSLYNVLDLGGFVNDRREAFETVAALPSAEATKSSVQLWSTTKGWGDADATWSSIGQEIVKCTKEWAALLADFVRSCRAVRRARFAGT